MPDSTVNAREIDDFKIAAEHGNLRRRLNPVESNHHLTLNTVKSLPPNEIAAKLTETLIIAKILEKPEIATLKIAGEFSDQGILLVLYQLLEKASATLDIPLQDTKPTNQKLEGILAALREFMHNHPIAPYSDQAKKIISIQSGEEQAATRRVGLGQQEPRPRNE